MGRTLEEAAEGAMKLANKNSNSDTKFASLINRKTGQEFFILTEAQINRLGRFA